MFSSHPPLLGTWTSASLATGVNVNNPGPLYYDLLALPTWLVGSAGAGRRGLGVALVNAMCGVGVGWVARRQGGHVVGAIAFAIVAVLAWSLGSEVLLDPTQPGAMVFPALVLFVLVWGVARGDVVVLPVLVVVASLVLQTYITYVYLVGVLSIWAVVGLVVSLRRSQATAGDRQPARRVVVTGLSSAPCAGRSPCVAAALRTRARELRPAAASRRTTPAAGRVRHGRARSSWTR